MPDINGLRAEGTQVLALYVRLVLLFLALGMVVTSQVVDHKTFDVGWCYGVLAVGFAANALGTVFSDSLQKWRFAFLAHTLFDISLITSSLVLSGDKDERIWFFYLLQVLSAGLVFFRVGAWVSATFASVSLAWVIWLYPDSGTPADWALYSALFACLAWLGGSLSEELHRTRQRLKVKSRRMEQIRALHENILESLPVGVMTVDERGTVNFINPVGEKILGLRAEVLNGRPIQDSIPSLKDFFAFERAAVAGVSQEGFFEIGGERRRLRKEIARLDASAAWTALLDNAAREGRLFVFEDVTDLRGLEDRLRQSEKLAAVGQLAAGIAHEIRNPLASVSGSIEMLRELGPASSANADARKLMDIAIREIERLNQLITEFLDYVKPASVQMNAVEIIPLLEEVVELVKRGRPDSLGVKLSMKWNGPSHVSGNAEKLRQVFWNLILNAFQAVQSKPGGGAGEISIESRSAGAQKVMLLVRDTGVGMDERTKSHLFEPFFTTKPKGTGLGLATAYKIIEVHRGEIRVKSEPGVGSTFEVILPTAEAK